MTADDDNRLSRWSRLKRKRARGEAVAEPVAEVTRRGSAGPVASVPPAIGQENALTAPADDATAEEDDIRELTAEEAAYVETLPPLEDLTQDSDFSGFMDKRVPEFLRRQALRKLWLSDPAFGMIDGMHEYGEDYSMMAQLAAGATAYRPDQGGYSWRDKPKEEDEAPEETTGAEGAQAEDGREIAADDVDLEAAEETVSEKARRVQDRGGSSVSLPTYTPNPYYQAPGQRNPAPEKLPEPVRPRISEAGGDDDDLGEAEDDLT